MNARVEIVPPRADGLARIIFEAVCSVTSPRIVDRHLEEQVIHANSGLPDSYTRHGHLGKQRAGKPLHSIGRASGEPVTLGSNASRSG